MSFIMVVDDNDENRYMLEVLLRGHGFTTVSARQGEEALSLARQNPPDLIITDILMPVMDGFTLCREWKADDRLKDIPFVFYTATYTDPKDEEFALSLGAERFIIKPEDPDVLLKSLREVLAARAVRIVPVEQPLERELEVFRQYNEVLFRKLEKKMADMEKANQALEGEIVVRKRIESELSFRNMILSTQQETSLDGILIVDEGGKIISYNKRFVELWGIRDDVIASKSDEKTLQSVLDKIASPQIFMSKIRYLYEHKTETSRDLIELKDRRMFDRYSSPMFGEDGKYYGRVWYFRDITEQRRLQQQLNQAQKMEAIGQLAGGVAHDFNNFLTAIIGYANLLKNKLEEDSTLESFVDEILNSAEKSADLTRQLLAFSRKQVISPKVTDINEMVRGIKNIIERLIGEDVEICVTLARKDLTVLVDPGQLEQVLMNLCTNARDVMPKGGTLFVNTDTVFLDEQDIKIYSVEKVGRYALISISDTGEGMDEETRQKIFEPFFTTKEVGKGTGLGLAIVYGIIKQHKGHISVYSEVGRGTTFRIYLPLLDQQPLEKAERREVIMPKGRAEVILIAEDNIEVRLLIKQLLKEYGYETIEAIDGEDAMEKFNANKDRIHLVITDVIMPKKSGKEIYDEIKKIQPFAKVLFTSGYTADIIHRKGILEVGYDFISKPLFPNELLRKIRNMLDQVHDS